MGIRSLLSKPLASLIISKQKKWMRTPVQTQEKVFHTLINKAEKTIFGTDHGFADIKSHYDFVKKVPIRGYEELKPYIEKIKKGAEDVLWPGVPAYFAKTSGTTSGIKYIPLTKDSIPNHINGARDALLNYIYETKKSNFLDGKLIFLSGSPTLSKTGNILTGRLSGIVNHHVPAYLRSNQMPSYDTNCIEEWEDKLDKIIEETTSQPMSLISGIPPWMQMYFDKLVEKTGKKTVKEIFPSLKLLVYGGVNFSPYRTKLFESIGEIVDSIELFPASEGFFAFQDKQKHLGMLLLLNAGIFYEFIPADELHQENPKRLTIGEVELNKDYALIISNNAGLWAYDIGDMVRFTTLKPYRVVVSGRTKHYISAFGEHVIAKEVEDALKNTCDLHPETSIIEFTVAPQVTPTEGLPHHEWLIEFDTPPNNLPAFNRQLDEALVKQNIYYQDLIAGKILEPLHITSLPKNSFQNYMKSQGKLGGQNKVPRLANDRKIADALRKYL